MTCRRSRSKLANAGALVGATDHSTTKALYAKDPDGLEFEVCWLVPERFLDEETVEAKTTLRPLNLDADIERYGLETVGGYSSAAGEPSERLANHLRR